MIPTAKLREQLYNGHKRKDLEKYEQLEQELKEKSQLNPALFHPPKTITTEDEKRELEEFREKVLNDKDRII